MIKTVTLGEKELTLSNSLAWATIYKDQFGHDIVPDVLPILSAAFRILGEMQQTDNVADLIKTLEFSTIQDALIELCAFQFSDLIHLVWAFNKAYDEKIDPPDKWVRQFDEFPLDIVIPAVGELLAKGLISSKNLTSLRGSLKASQ